MAEQDTKTELSKEVLAPPQEIREDLVSTAVKFLQNPKVTQSPLSQKKAFLQRKGLTDEEVEVAVQRAGAKDPVQVQSADGQHVTSGPVVMAPSVPQKNPEPVYSRWMRARDMIAVISVVTGMSYAAYRLYKELIRPILFGIPNTDERLNALEKNMSESMDKISQTLADMEKVLGKQEEKLQMISHDVNSKTTNFGLGSAQKETSITEIKSEIASLKGLLLNRRQFPPVPASVPSLPAWQLTHAAGDNTNNKGKDEDSTDQPQSPEITLSPTPSPLLVTGAATSTGPDIKLMTTENQSKDEELLKSQNQSIQGEIPVDGNSLVEKTPDLNKTDDGSEGEKLDLKGNDEHHVKSVNEVPNRTDDDDDDNVDRDNDVDSTSSLD